MISPALRMDSMAYFLSLTITKQQGWLVCLLGDVYRVGQSAPSFKPFQLPFDTLRDKQFEKMHMLALTLCGWCDRGDLHNRFGKRQVTNTGKLV